MVNFPGMTASQDNSPDVFSSSRKRHDDEKGTSYFNPVDSFRHSIPELMAPRPEHMIALVYGGGGAVKSAVGKGDGKEGEYWHRLVRMLESVPSWMLRGGGSIAIPALRQVGITPDPGLFPELEPHRDHPATRVIVNSNPSNPDMTNRGHMLFSDNYPHGRTNLRARTVNSGLRQILSGLPRGEHLHEISFYGHGTPGGMQIGDEWLTAANLDPSTPEGRESLPLLRQVRDHLGSDAVMYLRGCQCFQGEEGQAFGQRLADFFGRPVVGHTEVMGGLERPGQVTYTPRQ